MGASSTTALPFPSVVPHKSSSRRKRRTQVDRSLSSGVMKSLVNYPDSDETVVEDSSGDE
jgi:hypothetical protein